MKKSTLYRHGTAHFMFQVQVLKLQVLVFDFFVSTSMECHLKEKNLPHGWKKKPTTWLKNTILFSKKKTAFLSQ